MIYMRTTNTKVMNKFINAQLLTFTPLLFAGDGLVVAIDVEVPAPGVSVPVFADVAAGVIVSVFVDGKNVSRPGLSRDMSMLICFWIAPLAQVNHLFSGRVIEAAFICIMFCVYSIQAFTIHGFVLQMSCGSLEYIHPALSHYIYGKCSF